MTPRRATLADAATLARLNTHVQAWHAAHYPEAFFPNPDPKALAAHFADRLADPACTGFLMGEPATGYALCQLHIREASIFSPGYRRLMIDHIAVAPEARRQGQGLALLQAARSLARALQADEILLDTWESNHDAHALFRAAGFTPRRMLFRATPQACT
ncbi:MAG: GNAT family N-acetyltransferase [Tabrizicola sp.]|jgi:ribosomal protein S18 acetylase RimI-like enzyme|uniref:GNAT family N-acetyltransferase n=1 Tax=Tabrizicola sp. TaxID=2005166 RepID=UPI003BB11B40